MRKPEFKKTSINVHEKEWEEFRILSFKKKITFTALVERSLFLYNTDEEYRNLIHSTKKIRKYGN